jgi:REP element-mobilizing transposase RayT
MGNRSLSANGKERKISGRSSHQPSTEIGTSPGYFVSTVGRDEKLIREYIQRQEQEDRRLDQMKMFD